MALTGLIIAGFSLDIVSIFFVAVCIAVIVLYGMFILRLSRSTAPATLYTCRSCQAAWVIRDGVVWPAPGEEPIEEVKILKWGRLGMM
jgi:hypothetical protein